MKGKAQTTPSSSSSPLRGIIYTLIAMFLFSLVNAAIKYLSFPAKIHESYFQDPIFNANKTNILLFFRIFFALIPTILFAWIQQGMRPITLLKESWNLSKKDRLGQILVSVITPLSLFCLFKAFETLPLGDAQTVSFSSGIFVTLLAYPILKERPGPKTWLSLFLGTIGILIVAKPSQGMMQKGILWGLTFSLLQALITLYYKKISTSISSAVSMLYLGLIGGLFISFSLFQDIPYLFSFPLPLLLGLLGVGIFGGMAQLFVIESFRYAPASILTPFFYTSIVHGILFDALFWKHLPEFSSILGAIIIIASNLLLLKQKQ